ncbi:hypothetical protein ACOME3_007225 [Neoechinorhynchus agilis]
MESSDSDIESTNSSSLEDLTDGILAIMESAGIHSVSPDALNLLEFVSHRYLNRLCEVIRDTNGSSNEVDRVLKQYNISSKSVETTLHLMGEGSHDVEIDFSSFGEESDQVTEEESVIVFKANSNGIEEAQMPVPCPPYVDDDFEMGTLSEETAPSDHTGHAIPTKVEDVMGPLIADPERRNKWIAAEKSAKNCNNAYQRARAYERELKNRPYARQLLQYLKSDCQCCVCGGFMEHKNLTAEQVKQCFVCDEWCHADCLAECVAGQAWTCNDCLSKC